MSSRSKRDTLMCRSRWSDLPRDLLEKIIEKHKNKDLTDVYCRVRSVCRSWRCSIQNPNPKYFHLNPKPSPLRMSYTFQCERPLDNNGPSEFHFDVAALEILVVVLHPLATATDTDTGCILKLKQRKSGKLRAMNPLSSHQPIRLSHQRAYAISLIDYRIHVLYRSFYCKVYSEYPSSTNIKVSVIGDRICVLYRYGVYGFLKVGDLLLEGTFEDVVVYRGKFYAVDRGGAVVAIDPLSLSFSRCCGDGSVNVHWNNSLNLYLVESCGELFLVQKYFPYGTYIQVSMLDRVEGRWRRVATLGDRIFFVGGDAGSFSVSANDLPVGVCKKYWNCVYFSDSSCGGVRHDSDVRRGLSTKDAYLFSLKDKSLVSVVHCPGAMDIFWSLEPQKLRSNYKRKVSTDHDQATKRQSRPNNFTS